MISIIICSISPVKAEETRQNISETIGSKTNYEIIVFDNRDARLPIAAVYNKCALEAKGENLMFLHEDMRFKDNDWGEILENKLTEKDCGVIGFAGSIIKTAEYSGWSVNCDTERSHYWYVNDEGNETLCNINMPEGTDFAHVVTLDGCGMAVRKCVHERHPFDEQILTGFHCYDIDYTLEIAKYFKNYCCRINVLHMSNGSFDNSWIKTTIRMHEEKWKAFLPMCIDEKVFSDKEIAKLNEISAWMFFKTAYKAGSEYTWYTFKKFSSLPFSSWHTKKVLSGYFKILVQKRHKRNKK